MKHNPQPDTHAIGAPKPLLFHITASQDDTHLHTFCGDTIRKATAVIGKTVAEVLRSRCPECAEMKRLDDQFKAETQRELRVLKRYEAILDALRQLQDQEEQS